MNDMPTPEISQTVFPSLELANAGSDAARLFCNQGQIVAKSMTDWTTECSRFVTHRMNRSTEAMAQIANCHSFPEMFAVQAKWLQDAVDDYVKESSKLLDVNNNIVGSMARQVGQGETPQSPAKAPTKAAVSTQR